MCIEYRYGCTGIILKESYIRCDPPDCSRPPNRNTTDKEVGDKSEKDVTFVTKSCPQASQTFKIGLTTTCK